MTYVYPHARERWVERINPDVDTRIAEQEILVHEPAIAKAAAFGCKRLRIGNAVLVLDGLNVITVKRRGISKNWTRRQRREAEKALYT